MWKLIQLKLERKCSPPGSVLNDPRSGLPFAGHQPLCRYCLAPRPRHPRARPSSASQSRLHWQEMPSVSTLSPGKCTCHKMQVSPTKKACSRGYGSCCGEMKIQDRRIPTGLDILVVSAFWALDPTCKPQSHPCRMMITDWHLSIKEARWYHSLSRKKRHLSPKPRKRESFICIYLTNT